MSFGRDVSRFASHVRLNGGVVLRRFALDGLIGVVIRSPVDTGRFRANWRVGINRVDLTTDDGVDKSGQGTIGAGGDKLAGVTWRDEIHISNNLPYAERLENGHSQQAPKGMLKATLIELRTRARAIIGKGKTL